jgi:hypothetical protein
MDCIVSGGNGTYRAVFGYDNYTEYTAIVAIGPYNTMNPASLNGIQPTRFTPGEHRAAFATPSVPDAQPVSWSILGLTVTATSKSATCGPTVSLPADGNGVGPVLVLVASVGLSMGMFYVRQWRHRRRTA